LRRAAKIVAAAASVNFGWCGGAPHFFRRRRNLAAEGSTDLEIWFGVVQGH